VEQALAGLVVAVGIAVFAYIKNRAVRMKLRGRLRAEGEVVGHREHHRGASGAGSPTRSAPVVEFVDAQGRRVRGESGNYARSRPEPGTRVTVVYDPATPSEINVVGRDTGETERFFFGASLVLVGIALAGLIGTLITG
jgi:hypothetical protein